MTDPIKVLYCSTMLSGYSSDINEDTCKPNHVADWPRAFGEYPEVGVVMKHMGLNNMKKEWLEYVKRFDVIYMVLVSIADMKPCSWAEFPQFFKEKLGDSCPKIIMQVDNEMAQTKLNKESMLRKSMEASDMLVAVTKFVIEDWKNYNPNVKYVQSPRYYKDFVDPGYVIPPENKLKKRIAMLYHTWVPPDDYMGLTPHLRTAASLELPVSIFYSIFSGTFAPHIPLQYDIKLDNTILHPRLDGDIYMREIAKCYIGIEDSYMGASRFVSECAICKIPVISTEQVSSAVHLFPELLTPRMSIKEKIVKAKELLNDLSYYKDIAEKGYKRNLSHYSSETSVKRFVEALKECDLI